MNRRPEKPGILNRLKEQARRLKREIQALAYAYGDPRTGRLPKILIALTLAYALSPIDLIPDFIPVLGWLDDLILLPLLIALSIRLIPPEIMEECRKKAAANPPFLGKNRFAAAVIILIWCGAVFLVLRKIFFR